MLRLYSISLGCPKNRVDTERTLASLVPFGPLLPVADPAGADLVFINTCGFIASAVEESVRTMLKSIDKIQKLPQGERPVLAIAGCLVGRYGKETLAPDLPEADLILDSKSLDSWGTELGNALKRLKGKRAAGGAPLRLLSTGPSYAWLKVSDGCRHACSFCTIPSIRGPLRSTTAAVLRDEARELLGQGVKELVLVAQDLTAWGSDLGLRHGLVSLLETLLPLPGLERLRLMYLYPGGLTRELLGFLKEAGPPFVPYFDVPLQHAAPGVLSRMGRPFAGKAEEAAERIRSFFPDAALRTSIITGFPGETESDFSELLAFVEKTKFNHLGVFAYEAEEGTSAATMPGQIPKKLKQERRAALMDIQSKISETLLQNCLGRRLPVLVDAVNEEWPGLHTGRVWFQAPEIDGVTYVSGPGVTPGALLDVEIVETQTYDLVGLA